MSERPAGAHGAPGKNPSLYEVTDFSPERIDESLDGRFGRLFVIGDGWSDDGSERMQPNPLPRYDLRRLGAKDGPLDAEQGPTNRNSLAPAGITFLGQFIDHDITLDVSSKFSRPQINAALENGRTPNLDLDCVYGGGREASPYLYHDAGDAANKAKLIEGKPLEGAGTKGRFDLQRNIDGRAIIGDPRNDENIFVGQVQAAFIRFHNACVDYLSNPPKGPDGKPVREAVHGTEELYEKARDTTTHYYHRIVLEDLLYRIIGLEMIQAIATQGRQFYFPNGFNDGDDGWPERPFMPVEFSVAAYRYGHSTVRDEYVLNAGKKKPLFDKDLRGFQPLPKGCHLDWDWYFVAQDKIAEQFAHKIDPFLPAPLFELPGFAAPEHSLPSRNLMRGRIFRLPSGETIGQRMVDEGVDIAAREAMGPEMILSAETKMPAKVKELFGKLTSEYAMTETPLWLYVLMEAATFGKGFSSPEIFTPEEKASKGGDRLGPVGGRIVGEVLMGLLDHYRDATGKGLDYDPDIPSGVPHGVQLAGMKFGPRMSMRALIDFAYK